MDDTPQKDEDRTGHYGPGYGEKTAPEPTPTRPEDPVDSTAPAGLEPLLPALDPDAPAPARP